MKCNDCIYYNKQEYCERNNMRVYRENNICRYYVEGEKMGGVVHVVDENNEPVSCDRLTLDWDTVNNDHYITIHIDGVNGDNRFTLDELRTIGNILADRIYDGAYPNVMREYMDLYDKIAKIIRKE